MPKGEHFKKDNPRIHQVSFKVNKTELEQLRQVVKEANLSIPEWIRRQIVDPKAVITKVEKVVKTKIKKTEPVAASDNGVHKGEQTSLF